MTLNGVEAVILRYFSEFGSFRGTLRKSSRSLSHLLMSWNLFVNEAKRHFCKCKILHKSSVFIVKYAPPTIQVFSWPTMQRVFFTV